MYARIHAYIQYTQIDAYNIYRKLRIDVTYQQFGATLVAITSSSPPAEGV